MKNKMARFCLIALLVALTMDLLLIRQLADRTKTLSYKTLRTYEKHRVEDEVEYFPIACGTDEKLRFDFTDTWMADRSFGGDRQHEGCDIIPSESQPGICPVISMTDGVIEKIGWLRLGGYRIGIRSSAGNYYYYAHLESYASKIQEGSCVRAGEFLGFVGDSGYGEEGTTGQFVTHLHVGIYVPEEDGNDQAINPYPVLEHVKNRMIRADYH